MDLTYCRSIKDGEFYLRTDSELSQRAWVTTDIMVWDDPETTHAIKRGVRVYVPLCASDTQIVKERLRDLGYTNEEIEAMSPQQQEYAARLKGRPARD